MEEVTRQKIAMSEEQFCDYVSEEVQKYKKHAEFEAKADISFFDLQEKLKEYTDIGFTLTELQARYRYQYKNMKLKLDQWFDALVVYTQKNHNRLDIAGTKWLSSSELERIARVENSEEYQRRMEELNSVEAREKFITSLIKNWDNHNYILGQMSSNVRSEASSMNMEGRLSH